MQISDRERFEVLLEKLYAGFNMPMSRARSDAYFDGLQKMQLVRFSRCVDEALGENGPERIPSVTQIWKIYKTIAHTNAPLPEAKPVEQDHIAHFANRLLLNHITARGGLGSKGKFVAPYGMTQCEQSNELTECLKVKADLVDFFLELIREGSADATPAEFVKTWVKHVGAISPIAPGALANYTKIIAGPNAKKPFEKFMARDLGQKAA